jgi:type III restriction enzyme
MWRGDPKYEEMRKENRAKLLQKKQEPDNYIDILSIVEHPAFLHFYEDELGDAIASDTSLPRRAVGDLLSVPLKPDYESYDLFWPVIIRDREEILSKLDIEIERLEKYQTPLEKLKSLVGSNSEKFYSEEATRGVRFGEYEVTGDIFTAKNYNSFLSKMVNGIMTSYRRKRIGRDDYYPMIQIEEASIAEALDQYIRHRLFGTDFDPLKDNNWRILIMSERDLLVHILKNIGESVYNAVNNVNIEEAIVQKRYFSEVKEVRVREKYSLTVSKCIYDKLSYPSNMGGLERNFIEFIDRDSKVDSFIKIDRNNHPFVGILYLREDGILAKYFPDFLVRIGETVYIVETKAEKDMNSYNVVSKRKATLDFIRNVNDLPSNSRGNYTWKYVLLSESRFYDMKEKGANTKDIFDSIPTQSYVKGEGTLDDYHN